MNSKNGWLDKPENISFEGLNPQHLQVLDLELFGAFGESALIEISNQTHEELREISLIAAHRFGLTEVGTNHITYMILSYKSYSQPYIYHPFMTTYR